MKLNKLRNILNTLPVEESDHEVEVVIGEAADGKRLVIDDIVVDDNCGGDAHIVVIETSPQ